MTPFHLYIEKGNLKVPSYLNIFSFFLTGASDEPLTISSVFLCRALLTNAPVKAYAYAIILYVKSSKVNPYYYLNLPKIL